MPTDYIEEPERAWLACAIDSEGSITSSKYQRQVTITNTDIRFCSRCFEITERGNIYHYPHFRHMSEYYRWSIGGKDDVEFVLNQLLDRLILKKDKALEALSFYANKTSHQYNKRGKVLR